MCILYIYYVEFPIRIAHISYLNFKAIVICLFVCVCVCVWLYSPDVGQAGYKSIFVYGVSQGLVFECGSQPHSGNKFSFSLIVCHLKVQKILSAHLLAHSYSCNVTTT